MKKNVLILSDFSQVAFNATHYAMDLLQAEEVCFTLMNIYEPVSGSDKISAEAKRRSTLAILDERVHKLQARVKRRAHMVVGHYSEENLITAVRNFLAEHQVDLIVMGAVGEEYRHATILGNHTFEIMSKIKCNILAVPEVTVFEKPKNLLMPVDYAASFGIKNLRFLRDSGFFKRARLNVWEIACDGNSENEQHNFHKEIFSGLENLKLRFSGIGHDSIYEKSTWKDVQNKFDLIVLLGKNLKICDRLMHNRHGLYTSLPNKLPILVLHD